MSAATRARPRLVPPFTRVNGPTYWPTDALYPPLDPLQQRQRSLRMLETALPLALEMPTRQRFTPWRWPVRWGETPALPRFDRGPYQKGHLEDLSKIRLVVEVTLEAEQIDRTLDAPAEMLSGLARNHLLATHALRLRQLWAEFAQRDWPQGPLNAFHAALGKARGRP